MMWTAKAPTSLAETLLHHRVSGLWSMQASDSMGTGVLVLMSGRILGGESSCSYTGFYRWSGSHLLGQIASHNFTSVYRDHIQPKYWVFDLQWVHDTLKGTMRRLADEEEFVVTLKKQSPIPPGECVIIGN